MGTLLNDATKGAYLKGIEAEYQKLKTGFDNKKSFKDYLPYELSKLNGAKIDWDNYNATKPEFTGYKAFGTIDLDLLRPLYRLEAIFHSLGNARQLPRNPY